MVVADDGQQVGARAQRTHDALADGRVRAHDANLVTGQRARFQQDRVGDADLADVMDDPAAVEGVERALWQPQLHADMARSLGHAMRVLLGVLVLRLDSRGQREDHLLGAVERVVHGLQPQSRAHARNQLDPVDRLAHEVVGAGLQRQDPVVRVVERGQHHDRQKPSSGPGLDAPADLVAVHARHLHVEQDQVGRLPVDGGKRGKAVLGRPQPAVKIRKEGLDERPVDLAVVDDEHERRSMRCLSLLHHRHSAGSPRAARVPFKWMLIRRGAGSAGLADVLAPAAWWALSLPAIRFRDHDDGNHDYQRSHRRHRRDEGREAAEPAGGPARKGRVEDSQHR